MATPPNGAGHWRLDSNGQLVDSSDWDLADEIVKLQIGDGNENQVRTLLQSKISPSGPVSVQESSPLDTASQTSIDSASTNPFNQSANLNASHSRESSADTTGSQGSALSSNSQTLRAPPVTPLKVGAVGESRNRPHS